MMFDLKQKVVLVTGSCRGIGAGIIDAVLKQGATPVVTYHRNRELALTFCSERGIADCFALDVTRRDSICHVVNSVAEKYGRLDVLVNNAGILEQKPFLDITEEEWDETLATNLRGPFMLTQEVAKIHDQLKQKDCRIINISSVGGQFGGPKAPHYAASKGALITFTKSSARLLAAQGIRVNTIAPGFIRTEMYEHIIQKQPEDQILASIPLGMVGETEDIGAAVVYLASEAGRYMTGQVLSINGGSYI